MKPLLKISSIKAISNNLKERGFSWDEVYSYLHEYDPSVRYFQLDKWDSLDEYISYNCGQMPEESIALMYEELFGQDIMESVINDSSSSSIWRAGYYRLFVSHLTKDKEAVSNLKTLLASYGIDCFVAHEDIEPTKEWLKEIKRALNSADVLCAVFSPGFCESKWCDQEIGTALGRHIPTISISKGADPHGFLSEFQAIKAKDKAFKVAEDVFKAICVLKDDNVKYFHVLTKLLLDANNKEEALAWVDVVGKANGYPDSEIEEVYEKYGSNDVLKSEEVITKLNVLFKRINRRVAKSTTRTVDSDDLPF